MLVVDCVHLGSIASHNCPRLFGIFIYRTEWNRSTFVLWGIVDWHMLVLLLFVRPTHLVGWQKVNVDGSSNVFNLRLGSLISRFPFPPRVFPLHWGPGCLDSLTISQPFFRPSPHPCQYYQILPRRKPTSWMETRVHYKTPVYSTA